jgi:hypothetical protein
LPALALLAAGALAAPAAARERNDVVLMVGGDRIACEIIELEAANLSLRTPAFGTVNVDWPDVTGLLSIQLFEIRRADGTRLIGRLDVGDRPGVLIVRVDQAEPVEIPLAEVVQITQLGSSIWRSRRGHVDLGWNFAKANEHTSFSLDAEIAIHRRRFRWTNSLATTVNDNAESERSERDTLQSQLEIPMGRHFVGVGWAQHERNDDLDLVARDTLAGVVAWLPVEGARGRVALGPGIADSREDYGASTGTNSVSSAVLMAAGEYHRFGRFGTKASLSIFWFPVLSGPARNRLEVDAAFRQKLGSDFTLSISPYYSYDSLPPSPGAEQEDWGWVTSVGWQF